MDGDSDDGVAWYTRSISWIDREWLNRPTSHHTPEKEKKWKDITPSTEVTGPAVHARIYRRLNRL